MKSIILSTIACLCLVGFFSNNLFCQQPTQADSIHADSDWAIIANFNTWMMGKCIASQYSPNQINFEDKDEFLEKLDITSEDYENLHSSVQAAANRLIEKYNIQYESPCFPCSEPDSTITNKLKNIINYYRQNPSIEYNIHTNDASKPGIVGSNSCCPIGFYWCCAGCAATLEFFPAYLLCCYVCACGFCCDNICPPNQ